MIPHRKLILKGMWFSGLGVGVGLGGTGDEVTVGDGVKAGVDVRTGNKRVREGSGARVVVTVGLTV
jgi:hypothetical protein